MIAESGKWKVEGKGLKAKSKEQRKSKN